MTLADNHAAIGPDLTTYKAGPGFLRLWLADPAGVNPESTMPDLDLSEMEIETLIIFLGADAE